MEPIEQKGAAIGVDIGGTNLRAAVVDQTGKIVAFTRTKSPIADPTQGYARLVQVIRAVAAQANLQLGQLQGVGLGIPGWQDRLSGRLVFAPKMAHWQQIFDLERLGQELALPIYVDSDPHVATLGELWVGAGRGGRHLIMITLGTGIGCGIVVDGKLYVGRHGMAGELGHIIVSDDATVVCDCGLTGCLETQAAGPAIARQGRAAVESGAVTLIRDLVQGRVDCITTATVFCAAERGDPLAQSIVNRAGELIGFGLATLVSLCEPEKIIIGGGMAEVGDLLLKPMQQAMARRCYLIARGYITVEFVRAQLGDNAGVIGAARLAFSNES
ncbi:MAG: ROK family protein [Caldilineaceae bacterium]